MMEHTRRRIAAGGFVAAALFASGAFAHHVWDWAEDEMFELTGTIQEVYIGQPHPTLQVEADDGLWTVELGNPRLTEASGFVEGSAEPGDEVTALGNRSSDPEERRMKAVRITIGEDVYDIYPDRIPES